MKFDDSQGAQSGGAELVTVVWRDSADAVQSFFDQNGGGDWPIVLDESNVAVAYGVAKVPETWIVDPNGVIRFTTSARSRPTAQRSDLHDRRAPGAGLAGVRMIAVCR